MKNRNQKFYILLFIGVIALIISSAYAYFLPGFEPVLAVLASVTWLVETITIRQRKWAIAGGTFVAIIILGSITFLIKDVIWAPSEENIQLTIRVANSDGESIPRANVLLFFEGIPFSQTTDENGVANFTAKSTSTDARVIIETNEYQVYEQNISLSQSQTLNINLAEKDENNQRVIVRVIDENSNKPLEGAEVLLIVEGNIYEDASDSNGLAVFTIEFSEAEIDAELQVGTDEYEVSRKTITLEPERVQDIRLNSLTDEVTVSFTNPTVSSIIGLSTQPPEANVQELPLPINIEPINEIEPNNSSDEAQELIVIGMNKPINATVLPSSVNESDQDWYAFSVVAGQTYVLEIFNVANTLALVSQRYHCGGDTQSYSGLGLTIFDPSRNEVAKRCTPTGYGDVHTFHQFTAGINGKYYIQIISHSPVVSGGYSLRILPKYDENNATWDNNTFEPNNVIANSYPISPGLNNALTSVIEPRNQAYSTNTSDRDAYHFEATAGQSYVIELYNVSNTLALKTARYNCNGDTQTHTGLWFGAFDPIGNEVVRQCTPNGSGDVHSILQFTAGNNGIYHILVYPHEGTVAGNYSIRLLPQYDNLNAEWDPLTFEPNNTSTNAYPITSNDSTGLTSFIEPRNDSYSTNRADIDWYWFTASAGETYRIELFNVDSRLELESARYNCEGDTRNYTGLWVGIFDPSVNEVVRQCTPNGSGNVHSSVEFTASRDGIYYIRVNPHANTLSGDYSIRVVIN